MTAGQICGRGKSKAGSPCWLCNFGADHWVNSMTLLVQRSLWILAASLKIECSDQFRSWNNQSIRKKSLNVFCHWTKTLGKSDTVSGCHFGYWIPAIACPFVGRCHNWFRSDHPTWTCKKFLPLSLSFCSGFCNYFQIDQNRRHMIQFIYGKRFLPFLASRNCTFVKFLHFLPLLFPSSPKFLTSAHFPANWFEESLEKIC